MPQLAQIDIDLDGLVCGVPRKPCHNLVIDNLGQIFGDLFFLKGMGGVQRQAQALVAGAHHLTELAALLPTTVDAHAFPKAILAAVDVNGVQAIFAILVALGRKKYGRGKHGIGHGRLLPKQARYDAGLSVRIIVARHADIHGACHVAQIAVVAAVEP